MARTKKQTETTTTPSPLADVTPADVESAIRDVLAGDSTAAEEISAKAQQASEQEILDAAAEAAPQIEQAAKEIAKERTARKAPAKPRAATKRTTAAKPKPKASAKSDAPKTSAKDLQKMLLDGLKAKGVKASADVSPGGKYFRVLADGKLVLGYVHFRANGLRVRPSLVGNELPKTVKGFAPLANVRHGLGYGGTFRDQAGIEQAVEALSIAHAKLTKEA